MEDETKPRAIIHLDMDCFYAAIEVRDRPSLRGKPVGVGGARDRRGVLTTCNYEARAFGVRSAMPTFMALQRCPNLIVLPTRFDVYRKEAGVVREIMHRFTPLVETLSLDEAYLDVTDNPRSPGPLAREIRDLIFKETRLTASAGVGPNKLVAKIASEINKPNGQYEVKPEKVPEFMQPLPVRKLWGIGAVAEERLARAGVTTCGEMQRLSRPELHELFWNFGSDLTTLEQCEEKVGELFEELAAELAQKEPTRRITKIFLKLKFSDFTRTTVERAGLLPNLGSYRQLLEEAFARTGKKIRLVGIGVRFAEIEQEVAQLPLL